MPTRSPSGPRIEPSGAGGPPAFDKGILLKALQSLKRGDFTVELPADWVGIDGKIADAFNDIVELNRHTRRELDRLSRVVGKEGKLAQRAVIGSATGAWGEPITSVNALIDDLACQLRAARASIEQHELAADDRRQARRGDRRARRRRHGREA